MNEKQEKHLWMVEDKIVNGEARSYWTKIGHATQNKDGSFTLFLAAIPISGKIQMRDGVRNPDVLSPPPK
jgi:hypothetical protein